MEQRRRLTLAQERLWFLQQLNPGTSVYNEYLCLRLSGALSTPAVEQALTALTRRHESLRWVVRNERGSAVAIARDAMSDGWMRIVDLSGLDDDAVRLRHYRREATEVARRPIDLARGPLVRVRVFRLSARELRMIVVMHHIISDAWSLRILMEDLCELYGVMRLGVPAVHAVLDYDRACDGEHGHRDHVDYWTRRLANPPAPVALPTHRRRAETRSFSGAKQYFTIDGEVYAHFKARLREERVTPFVMLLALWTAHLGLLTGSPELIVGTTTAGRQRKATERLIGFFANTLAIRTEVNPHETFRGQLRHVRAVALEALDHQDAPLERVVQALNLPRRPNQQPLFEMMFIYVNTPVVRFDLGGVDVRSAPDDIAIDLCKFDLVLSFCDDGTCLQGLMDYSTELYDATEIRAHIRGFQYFVAAALADPDRPLRRMSPLGASATAVVDQLRA